jgi:hypothetical protein
MSSVLFTRVVGIAIVLSVTATAIVTAAPADVAMIKSRQEKLRDMGSAARRTGRMSFSPTCRSCMTAVPS